MNYSELDKRLKAHFDFTSNRVSKERRALEKKLGEFASLKIVWWKPWTYFQAVNKIQKMVPTLASITAGCLEEVIELQKTQMDCLNIQKIFQQEIDSLQKRISERG